MLHPDQTFEIVHPADTELPAGKAPRTFRFRACSLADWLRYQDELERIDRLPAGSRQKFAAEVELLVSCMPIEDRADGGSRISETLSPAEIADLLIMLPSLATLSHYEKKRSQSWRLSGQATAPAALNGAAASISPPRLSPSCSTAQERPHGN